MVKISDSQMKGLFKSASLAKERGEKLDKVFTDFAVKTGRAKGSVRNFYYSMLKRAEDNYDLKQRYLDGVSLSANKIIGFTEDQSDALLEKVLLGVTFGKSVRRVISEISDDGKTALRNQNKYRNLLRFDRERVERVRQKILTEYGKCVDPFAKRRLNATSLTLLKKEINDLFERVGQSLKRENEKLKAEIEVLKRQNLFLNASLQGVNAHPVERTVCSLQKTDAEDEN